MGIEPTLSAWKAEVLPLNYTRAMRRPPPAHGNISARYILVEGGGFEPPKVEPSDLQSDPFGHSGTPPKHKPRIMLETRPRRQPDSGMNCAGGDYFLHRALPSSLGVRELLPLGLMRQQVAALLRFM